MAHCAIIGSHIHLLGLLCRGVWRRLLGLAYGLGQRLLVGSQNGILKLHPSILRARKADIFVLAVPGFVAGHGYKEPLAALHNLDAPDGEATVDIHGCRCFAGALRPECVDLDIIVGGVDRMGIAGAVGCFGGFLFFCPSVGLLFLNIKMSGLAALGSQGHGHTWFLPRRFQLDRNDGRAVHIVELAAGIVIELDEV